MSARKFAQSPAEFDFDVFKAGFKRPQFTARLYRRADLVPKLAELDSEIGDLDSRIDRVEKSTKDDEQDVTAEDPLSALKLRRVEATEEWNDLAGEYEASAVVFTFRLPDNKADKERIDALLAEAGLSQPEMPDDADDEAKALFEKAASAWIDALAVRSMSVTCVSHQLSVEQWEELREIVGDLAFSNLTNAWAEAVQAIQPSAAFLRKPLPKHTTDMS